MTHRFDKIGVLGAGWMGTMMAFLFSEHDSQVSLYDISSEEIERVREIISDSPQHANKIRTFDPHRIDSFVMSLGNDKDQTPRLFVFSLPHGEAVDKAIDSLSKHFRPGDIIIDGGNEWYRNTDRRQMELMKHGVHLIGCGVSGGYQSARHGPSLSPGGDHDVLKNILPQMKEWAAKDQMGNPCVTMIGPGGSGHYVKMIHNGIEQGMLGVLNEVWEMLFKCLHTNLDDLSKIFEGWAASGELKNNFLVSIGADICSQKKQDERGHILNEVQDKVVQDADNSEGTGVWTVMEAAKRHVSTPTIAASHFLRIASANRAERLKIFELVGGTIAGAKKQHVDDQDRPGVIEDLRQAVYCGFLASYIQGMNLLSRANKDESWKIQISEVIRIWRNGCIIRSDHIADLFQPIYQHNQELQNILTEKKVIEEIQRTYPSLKRTVQRGLEWDSHMPSLTASMEYLKYCGGRQLPTQFMEAQLDYFGAHSYDQKCEGPGTVKKGAHHHEWKPA